MSSTTSIKDNWSLPWPINGTSLAGVWQKRFWWNPLEANLGEVFMLLSEIKEKQTARVVRVGGNGALRRRILEMGILKGSEIYVEKYAPLKDPVELIVKGYHISLRVEEAAQITVEPVE
jgi:Fe2+ transport system protein FeoA